MKSLRQQYERHTGERNAGLFGDLTWLTPAAEETPQVHTSRPLYRGKHHPALRRRTRSPSRRRCAHAGELRSAIYGVFYHIKTLEGNHDTVLQKLKDSYDEFGSMADELKKEQAEQLLSREPSKLKARWVPWPISRAVCRAPAGIRRRHLAEKKRCRWPSTSCFHPPATISQTCAS